MIINFLVDYTCGRQQSSSGRKRLLNEKYASHESISLGEQQLIFYFNQAYLKVLIKGTHIL